MVENRLSSSKYTIEAEVELYPLLLIIYELMPGNEFSSKIVIASAEIRAEIL